MVHRYPAGGWLKLAGYAVFGGVVGALAVVLVARVLRLC